MFVHLIAAILLLCEEKKASIFRGAYRKELKRQQKSTTIVSCAIALSITLLQRFEADGHSFVVIRNGSRFDE